MREFEKNLRNILPLVSFPGKLNQKFMKQIFADFDLDNSGYLEKREFKLFLVTLCHRLDILRPSNSKFEYIFSQMDYGNNKKIELKEQISNYYIIKSELKNNMKIKLKKNDIKNRLSETTNTQQIKSKRLYNIS